jgi:hypothetical protein
LKRLLALALVVAGCAGTPPSAPAPPSSWMVANGAAFRATLYEARWSPWDGELVIRGQDVAAPGHPRVTLVAHGVTHPGIYDLDMTGTTGAAEVAWGGRGTFVTDDGNRGLLTVSTLDASTRRVGGGFQFGALNDLGERIVFLDGSFAMAVAVAAPPPSLGETR